MIRRLLFTRPLWSLTTLASLLAVLYWGLMASDRYVSEAHVIVQSADLANGQGIDIAGLIGTVNAANQADQLLLRDRLLSVDMLLELDAKLDLRSHYSDSRYDLLSRMWSADASIEWFHRHYLSRIGVDYDSQSGLLVIKAQAYDPKMAQSIATLLVEGGERFMNEMGHKLAGEQVAFLEQQVAELHGRVLKTRQELLDFQNKKGLVSPQATAENLVIIINRLEAQLTELKTRRAAMQSYLMADSPGLVELDQQILAVQRQIEYEKVRLTKPGGQALNSTVEKYQLLQMNSEFALDVYKVALAALESGRIDAARKLKKVSVLQSPFEPQYPIQPGRIYNSVVFILVALLIAGIVHMLGMIIRDHRD